MTAEQILDGIERMCRLGGDVFIAPVDRLNVEHGYRARVTLPNGSANGADFHGSGFTARDALAEAIALGEGGRDLPDYRQHPGPLMGVRRPR